MRHTNFNITGIKFLILSILSPLLIQQGFAQTIPADSLYLGQTPPGDSAVVFATGKVTLPNRNVPCISFAPDGKSAVFYVAFWPNPGTPYSMLTEYKNNRWSTPAPASFTTGNAQGISQFRGINRDGQYNEAKLLNQWPKDGPDLLWTTEGIGLGYAAPSILNGRRGNSLMAYKVNLEINLKVC